MDLMSILFFTKVAIPKTDEITLTNIEAKIKQNKVLIAATRFIGMFIILSKNIMINDIGISNNILIKISENNIDDIYI